MSKKPNLTLVSDPSAKGSGTLAVSDGLDFVSVDELGSTERKRVERLIEVACPRAGILAVARNLHTWDVRPVVAIAGEDGPSLIRPVGPDVSFNPDVQKGMMDTLERLTRFTDLSSVLRDWGTVENQIWFRRGLLPKTFAHTLSGPLSLSLEECVALIRQLAEQIRDWHSHGLVHGHITSSNIYYDGKDSLALIDAGVGASFALTAKESSNDLVQTIAPELLGSGSLSAAADVYGFGQVIRRLILLLRKKHQFTDRRDEVAAYADSLSETINQMISEDPEARPRMAEVARLLRKKSSDKTQEVGRDRKQTSSGKIVRPGQVRVGGARGKAKTPPVEQATPKPTPKQTPDPAPKEVSVEDSMFEDLFSDPSEPVDSASTEPELFLDAFDQSEEEGEDFLDVEVGDDVLSDQPAPSRVRIRREGSSSRKHETTGGFGWFVLGLCAVLALVYYVMRVAPDGYSTVEYNPLELRMDWESRIPSRMLTVAEVAVEKGIDNKTVQDLIVASANNGEELPAVDIGLLRIAFNSLWEVELQPEDRRTAIAFALARLLNDRAPRDLESLEERHPGVLLAITASAGENMNRVLKDIPASTLLRLPPPYGPAFARLVKENDSLNLADPGVQALARFRARGIGRVEDLALYLRTEATPRLQALAMLFSHDNYEAKVVLERLLNHPNIVLDMPEIVWARTWELMKWEELEESDQLFVLAGAAPSGMIRAENIAKLFMHPSAGMRGYAIDQALNRVKFKHPASVSVLGRLKQNPESLGAEQLARLAGLLQDPGAADEKRIEALLSTEPPIEIMADVLLGTHSAKQAYPMDTWVAVYLNTRDWEPNVVQLRKLSLHPDSYTRLFAYNKILKLPDEQTARVFLETALSRESDPEFRTQLKLMILQLQKAPKS